LERAAWKTQNPKLRTQNITCVLVYSNRTCEECGFFAPIVERKKAILL